MTRTQFPLVAGFALTINNAQSLTIKEGTVINLAGSKRFRPASKHGLPFVAFTRSESFAMTAFKNLPPWDDFAKGWDSDMLRMRLEFTSRLEEMHQRILAKHSAMKTRGMQEEAHQLWRESQVKRHKENPPAIICLHARKLAFEDGVMHFWPRAASFVLATGHVFEAVPV